MQSVISWTNRTVEYLIVVLLVFITALVFAQVLLRIVAYSIVWAEELSRYVLVWLIFLATALAVGKKAHLSMDFLLERLHNRARLSIDFLGSVILIFFFVALGYYALQIFGIWMRKTSPILGLPMIYVFVALPVSTALILLNLMGDAVAKLRCLKNEIAVKSGEKEV